MKRQNKTSRIFLISITFVVLAASCVTPRKVNYLRDMTPESQIELENRFEAVVSPYDELFIRVFSHQNPELAQPFNINQNNNGYSGNQNLQTYLVDINGNIQIPVLGDVHVAGLTRLKIQDTIASLLKQEGYLTDPLIQVRFANFKIFFLGASGCKAITISNERCTFLEALALSGGLDDYTKRSKVGVMREVNGKMTLRYLDPRSSEVFNDPYFMLQQNDIIITEHRRAKFAQDNWNRSLTWISTITSLASLAASILVYFTLNNQQQY